MYPKIKLSGIYKLTNIITNEYYIGMSIDIFNRLSSHYTLLYLNKHHSPLLQESFNKHSIEAFSLTIIQKISKSSFKKESGLKGKKFESTFKRYLLKIEREVMSRHSKELSLNEDNKYFQ